MKKTLLFLLLLILCFIFLIVGLFLDDILGLFHITPSKILLYIEKILIYTLGFLSFWLFTVYRQTEKK